MIAALIPAAGHSSRMGRPKPLLKIHGRPMLGTIIIALRVGGASPVIVITPPAGRAETDEVIAMAEKFGAIAVTPTHQTADMRATIELGLDSLGEELEGLLLCPCDTPGIAPALVAQVIAAGLENLGTIIVPIFGSKRGHPVFLPRSVLARIRTLPQGQGVKSLFDDPSLPLLECDWPEPLGDIDTPEDYRRWTGQKLP